MSGHFGKHPVTGEPIWIETDHVSLDKMVEVLVENRRLDMSDPIRQQRAEAINNIAGQVADQLALEFAGLDPDVVLTVALQVLGRLGGAMASGANFDIAMNVIPIAVAMWAGKIERPGGAS